MIRVVVTAPDDARIEAVAEALDELEHKLPSGLKRRDFNADLYKRFRDYLDAEFHNKCAYCEVQLVAKLKPAIDHYRPIMEVRDLRRKVVFVSENQEHPGYWWTAYEWGNLLPTCDPCNSAKSTRFPIAGVRVSQRLHDLKVEDPLVINPLEPGFVPSDHFELKPDGELVGLTDKGLHTIDVCNLNRKKLRDQRKSVMETTRLFVATLAQAAVNGVGDLSTYRALLKTIDSGEAPFAFAGRWALQEARRAVAAEFSFAA